MTNLEKIKIAEERYSEMETRRSRFMNKYTETGDTLNLELANIETENMNKLIVAIMNAKQEEITMKNGLNLDNLINTYYYNGEYELEFYVDGRYVFVRNIKEEDHPTALSDEWYFDDFVVIDEIIKNADENDIIEG